jgi:hypothetical protein
MSDYSIKAEEKFPALTSTLLQATEMYGTEIVIRYLSAIINAKSSSYELEAEQNEFTKLAHNLKACIISSRVGAIEYYKYRGLSDDYQRESLALITETCRQAAKDKSIDLGTDN